MSLLIVLFALGLLIFVACRGHGVILFAPVAALLAVLLPIRPLRAGPIGSPIASTSVGACNRRSVAALAYACRRIGWRPSLGIRKIWRHGLFDAVPSKAWAAGT